MVNDPKFRNQYGDLTQPGTKHFAITPGPDSLPFLPRGIWVGGAGIIVLVDEDGTELDYDVPAGTTMIFRADKVLAETTASPSIITTATNIRGWY